MGKNIRVLIAVPSYFHIDPYFHQCLMAAVKWLAEQPQDENAIHGRIVHSFGDSPHVGRSRNMLTRAFLEGDYTDLLFIDSDIVFSVDHIKRILSHDEDVVGGIYFKKSEGKPEACINSIRDPIIRPDGLAQVAYIGTGFMRIRRSVFDEIIARWGEEIAYCPDATKDILEYNFWNLSMNRYSDAMIPPNPERAKLLAEKYKISEESAMRAIQTRWLSEDWWFCQRCMDLGIRVWADRGIALRHSGNVLYPLETQEQAVFESQKAPDSADAEKSTSPLATASA